MFRYQNVIKWYGSKNWCPDLHTKNTEVRVKAFEGAPNLVPVLSILGMNASYYDAQQVHKLITLSSTTIYMILYKWY